MTQLRVRGQAATALAVLRLLFRERFALDFSVRLWDGTHVRARNDARFTFEVRTPFALRAAFTPPIALNPARAFIENWIDLPGDAGVPRSAQDPGLQLRSAERLHDRVLAGAAPEHEHGG